jgi:hypothetical protein
MKKIFVLITACIFFAGIISCNKEVAAPPKITITTPEGDKYYKVNTPITLNANLYDKTGLASAKLYVNSAWVKTMVFADTQESLGGVESLDYTTTFVIDSLVNYPKATYWVELTVTDVDGNAKSQQVLISLKP